MALQIVTKQVICSDEDLYTFGLHLGLRVGQIRQKRTNNPHSVEIAALEAVTEWWDSGTKTRAQKVDTIANCVKKIGKATLVSFVMEKLQPEHSNGQLATSAQIDGNDNNDERQLNGNDRSEILEQLPEPSNGQVATSTQTNGNDNNDEGQLNGNDGSEFLPELSNGQLATSMQTNGNDNNDEGQLNGNDGSEFLEQLPEPSNGQLATSTQTNGNDNNDEGQLNGNDGSEFLPEPSNAQLATSLQRNGSVSNEERELYGNDESEILDQLPTLHKQMLMITVMKEN